MNAKIMAMMMVGVMMFSGLAITMGNEDNTLDAVVGDGGAYSYTLTYHNDQMANTSAQELQLTVDGMTPISHASGTTTLSSVANEGSWAFNTTTGIGPFNSFYAAFDMTDGNKFVSVLDPYDLTKKIDGTALDNMTKYNIMWVLPTVYISADSVGNITLSNDPSSGTAYAHTINGEVRKYVAYGVYEASLSTVSGTTVLTSTYDSTPAKNYTRANFRQYAHNYDMDDSLATDPESPAYSMLWNYYQWQLYRFCSLMVLEGFNSQGIVGNGISLESSQSTTTTGETSNLGPYAGNPAVMSPPELSYCSSAKLFIENAWGSLDDLVDGIIVYGIDTFYIDSSSNPSDNTTGSYIEQVSGPSIGILPPSTGLGGAIYYYGQNYEKLWGMPNVITSTPGTGTCDQVSGNSALQQYLLRTGGAYYNAGSVTDKGLNYVRANSSLSTANDYIGTRLAFVFDEVPSSNFTVTATASSYGSVSPASVTQPYGSAISASGNVLTIGSQTITATPDAADAQYTYTFTGWSTFPSTLTENTSVTANFDRTVNTYTITWSISGSTTSETLSYGAMPEHEDPVPPEGYLFAGWNPEIAAVTGDQTYTAVFEEIVYITVTFDPNGGQLEGSATKTVGIGTPYGELPTPKKDNNKFLGWYTDAEEGTLVTADTIVTADAGTTLYAHWELTGFAAMLKPLLFLFPLILLAFLAIALVRTFA